jgi:tetratricopeptide (TPR) repeat protein
MNKETPKYAVSISAPSQGTIVGDDNTVNQTFNQNNHYQYGGLTWNTRLLPISEWRLESFQLGDTEAANFRYVITPVQDVFVQVMQTLEQMNDTTTQVKNCGILVTGESNAGKTRLAVEALKQALPDWLLMHWLPGYTNDDIPPAEPLKGKSIVLFLDDLQEHVLVPVRDFQDQASGATSPRFWDQKGQITATSQRSATLRTLIDTLRRSVSRLVIVATCRSEDLNQVYIPLGWLCDMLIEISLPAFSGDPQDPLASQTIAEIQKQGTIHIEDWDGTLGSLILGLSRKRRQYLALPPHAKTVLRTMKLLLLAGTPMYTEQRIRSACARVFAAEQLLEDEQIWQETIDLLTQIQFVKEEAGETSEMTYTLRKDSYFERVISDYPASHRPQQMTRNLIQLQSVFEELEDAQALLNLSFSLIYLEQLKEALATIDLALSLDPNNAVAWHNKGTCLARLGRNEEALASFEHVLALDPSGAYTWSNRGACLAKLNRVPEALDSFKQALELDPGSALIWHDKGLCLLGLENYQEALEAFERSLRFDPHDASAWRGKAKCLLKLERFEQTLKACDHALSLDPGSVEAWNNKGISHVNLNQYGEAYAAVECALMFDANNIQAWHNKGACLWQLGRYQEALEALEQAIKLHTGYAYTWYVKGECLFKLENYEDALASFEQAIKLNPDDVQLWGRTGACLSMLGRLDEALMALDKALTLDPNDANAREGKKACLNGLGRNEEALAIIIPTQALAQVQPIGSLPQSLSTNHFNSQHRKKNARKNTGQGSKRRRKR